MTGFEPATPSSRTKYATRLRYIPILSGTNVQLSSQMFEKFKGFLVAYKKKLPTKKIRQLNFLVQFSNLYSNSLNPQAYAN